MGSIDQLVHAGFVLVNPTHTTSLVARLAAAAAVMVMIVWFPKTFVAHQKPFFVRRALGAGFQHTRMGTA